jgi:hypothetical protein
MTRVSTVEAAVTGATFTPRASPRGTTPAIAAANERARLISIDERAQTAQLVDED